MYRRAFPFKHLRVISGGGDVVRKEKWAILHEQVFVCGLL
jgi:hypothetical protein